MTFLKRIAGAALGATLLLGSGPISPPARAYVVMLEEVGSDVVATGSGPINLTGLNFVGASTDQSQIIPDIGAIVTGPAAATSFTRYSGYTGSPKFGDRQSRSLPIAAAETSSAYSGLKMLLSCQTTMFPAIRCRALRHGSTRPSPLSG